VLGQQKSKWIKDFLVFQMRSRMEFCVNAAGGTCMGFTTSLSGDADEVIAWPFESFNKLQTITANKRITFEGGCKP
jgi:hypothetical protein